MAGYAARAQPATTAANGLAKRAIDALGISVCPLLAGISGTGIIPRGRRGGARIG
jgi:hypothetical protein